MNSKNNLTSKFLISLGLILTLQACSFNMKVSDTKDKTSSESQTPITDPGSGTQPDTTSPATPSVPSTPAITPEVKILTHPDYINNSNANSYPVAGTCNNVSSIDIKINSNVVSTVNCNSGTWNASLNTTPLSDGTLTFSASEESSTTNLDSKNIVKDASPPASPPTIDDGDQIVSTINSSWIGWSPGSDAGSGVSRYEVRLLDNANAEIVTWTNAGSNLGYSFSGVALTEGQNYKAEVRSIDSAGNTSTSSTQGNGWEVVPAGWKQQAYLKPPNPDSSDNYGANVAIFNDTIVVGSTNESSNQTTITNGTTASSNNSLTGAGAVFVYKRNGTSWTQEAYIKPPNPGFLDYFGESVAIFEDTIAVGAMYEDSNLTTITNGSTASTDDSVSNSGAVYIYKRVGTTWTQEAYLKASNAEAGDIFGADVAIYGDTLVVGANSENSNQTTVTNGPTASADNTAGNSGAAYVFKRNGTTWTQEAYLKAPNAEAGDNFGEYVDIFGDTIAISALYEASNQTSITNGTTASANNSVANSGAVYIFKRNGTSWAQEAYIKPPNPDSTDFFGIGVSIHNDTLAVSAIGESSNLTSIINGSTASSDNSSVFSGAAYIFKRNGSTWTQEAFIKAPNAEAGDSFGESISIYGDVVVVGAGGEDSNQTTITNGPTASTNNSLVNVGAAYVFKRNGTTWAQEAYLKPPNPTSDDNFGSSIALYNDTVVVGSAYEDSNQSTITNGATASSDNSIADTGAAYVFKADRSPLWQQQAYIKASNSEAGDSFANKVALSGDTLIVGALGEDSNQTTITNAAPASSNNGALNAGSAYIFKRTGANWSEEAYLKAPNTDAGDLFGTAVSIDKDTAVVGAILESSNQTTITNGSTASSDNSASGAGAAYVFKRTGTTWAQEAYLKAPNAEAGDSFGSAVAISGDTLVVGANNEDSNQTTITNGTTASSDNSASGAGAAYVFKRVGTTWTQEAYLKAPNAEASDSFGNTVAISGDTLIIGAPNEDSNQTTITNGTTASSDNSADGSGAAYVFKRTGTSWTQEAYLKAPNAEAGDSFGHVVDISGDSILVTAISEDSNQTTVTNGITASSDNSVSNSGAVYIFKRTNSQWAQEAYIKSPNTDNTDRFGFSASISGDTVVIGSYQEDNNQTTISSGPANSNNLAADSGAAYVFKRLNSKWTLESYLKAPNAETNDWFGYSVAVSGNSIAVGAYLEDSNQTTITNGATASSDNSSASSGAAYIFNK